MKFVRFHCQLVRLHWPRNGVVPEEATHWASQGMRFLGPVKEWKEYSLLKRQRSWLWRRGDLLENDSSFFTPEEGCNCKAMERRPIKPFRYQHTDGKIFSRHYAQNIKWLIVQICWQSTWTNGVSLFRISFQQETINTQQNYQSITPFTSLL